MLAAADHGRPQQSCQPEDDTPGTPSVWHTNGHHTNGHHAAAKVEARSSNGMDDIEIADVPAQQADCAAAGPAASAGLLADAASPGAPGLPVPGQGPVRVAWLLAAGDGARWRRAHLMPSNHTTLSSPRPTAAASSWAGSGAKRSTSTPHGM